jgi:hypothetical protein
VQTMVDIGHLALNRQIIAVKRFPHVLSSDVKLLASELEGCWLEECVLPRSATRPGRFS